MDPSGSAEALRRFLRERSIDASSTSLDALIAGALGFYAEVPAVGLHDADSDWLLFQFGVFDWGRGEMFEIDVTRQFVTPGEQPDDDPEISQLRCTVYYEPTPALRAIPAANRWCQSHAELPEFRAFILSSDAYLEALRAEPVRRSIEWSPV